MSATPSAMEQTLGIYELIERILFHLPTPTDIIRSQRVCRTWRDIIQRSPALHEACWYKPPSSSETRPWTLNPVFNRLGICTEDRPGIPQKRPVELFGPGGFSLEKRIYDKSGSWTTMLATDPPCKTIMVTCYGDYSGDENMFYLIKSKNYLLLGDIMAILAECQNRQEYGVDRWAGVKHFTGRLSNWSKEADTSWEDDDWLGGLERMSDNVDIKVFVSQAWGSADVPGFSLRRVDAGNKEESRGFLHELVVHDMVDSEGGEYQWHYYDRRHKYIEKPTCREGGPYKANLVAVREIRGHYLEDCRHIYRLLA